MSYQTIYNTLCTVIGNHMTSTKKFQHQQQLIFKNWKI